MTRGSRTLVLPPFALAVLVGLLPIAGVIYLAATCYFIFHDDLLAGLTRRQIEMQYSYEDRLARLRHEITNLTQHARINEAELAERLGSLTARQGQLESRTTLVVALAERAKALHGSAGASAVTPKTAAGANPLWSGAFAPDLPTAASANAPLSAIGAGPEFGGPKPQPEGFELRLDDQTGARPPGAADGTAGQERRALDRPALNHDDFGLNQSKVMTETSDISDVSRNVIDSKSVERDAGGKPVPAFPHPALAPLSFDFDLPLATQLDHLAARQDHLDHVQLALLNDLQEPAKRISTQFRAAFNAAGLAADQLVLPAGEAQAGGSAATGGPFVPLPEDSRDGAAFVRAATDAQSAIATAEKLGLIATHVPLAAPLPGPLDVTSPFGPRIDPFLGRPALHTGVDLREDYGAQVRATADGTVVFAHADGGYGNMVEIDHGNGLSTRYAHLSSFAVRPGEKVKAGTIVGRIGETGRATGPHLHYETRIDGEPVNPERFLKAGLLLRMARNGSEL
ncbi:MAG: M23 family metallopeptidase [Methylovirgula sp.]